MEPTYNNPATNPPIAETPGIQTTPPQPPVKANKGKLVLTIVAVLAVVLAIAGAGLWFFVLQKQVPTDMTTLNDLALNTPANMNGFGEDGGAGTLHSFVTSQTSNGSTVCQLQFGTQTAQQMPGNDVTQMFAPQVNSLKDNGATVNGPNRLSDLILKSATDSSKTYKLPTYSYSFISGGTHGQVNIGAAILKNSNRAVVIRLCTAGGNLDQAKISAVENTAKQITVTSR